MDLVKGQIVQNLLLTSLTLTENFKDAQGNQPSIWFINMPDPSLYPDYVQIVKQPMTISIMKEKVQNLSYNSAEDLAKDWKQLIQNAVLYNGPENAVVNAATLCSKIWEKALVTLYQQQQLDLKSLIRPQQDYIQDLTNRRVKKTRIILNPPAASPPSMTSPTSSLASPPIRPNVPPAPQKIILNPRQPVGQTQPVQKPIGDLRDDILKIATPLFAFTEPDSGRQLIQGFMSLPSRETSPDYYHRVTNPISARDIFTKIQNKSYKALSDFSVDMETMFRNARSYYPADHGLHQDAIKLTEAFRTLLHNSSVSSVGKVAMEPPKRSIIVKPSTTPKPPVSIVTATQKVANQVKTATPTTKKSLIRKDSKISLTVAKKKIKEGVVRKYDPPAENGT